MNPLAILGLKALAVAAALAAIAFAWNGFLNYEQRIGYDRAVAEYNVKLIAAKDDARAQEQAYAVQLNKAQGEANDAINARDARVSALTTQLGGMRGTISNVRSSLSSGTLDACRTTANTLSIVFQQCTERLVAMGSNAEGHLIDSLMYQQAWPKSNTE